MHKRIPYVIDAVDNALTKISIGDVFTVKELVALMDRPWVISTNATVCTHLRRLAERANPVVEVVQKGRGRRESRYMLLRPVTAKNRSRLQLRRPTIEPVVTFTIQYVPLGPLAPCQTLSATI